MIVSILQLVLVALVAVYSFVSFRRLKAQQRRDERNAHALGKAAIVASLIGAVTYLEPELDEKRLVLKALADMLMDQVSGTGLELNPIVFVSSLTDEELVKMAMAEMQRRAD